MESWPSFPSPGKHIFFASSWCPRCGILAKALLHSCPPEKVFSVAGTCLIKHYRTPSPSRALCESAGELDLGYPLIMWLEQPSISPEGILLFLLPGWVVCICDEWWASPGPCTVPGSVGICRSLSIAVVYRVQEEFIIIILSSFGSTKCIGENWPVNEVSFSDLRG